MGENKYKSEANPVKVNYNQEPVSIDYNFERMIKSFLKDVEKRGIIKEIRDRRYYVKPSEQKRLAQKKRRK